MAGSGLRRPDLFLPVHRQGKRPLRKVFFFGDHRPRKGLGDFLQAAEQVHAACPDVEFWIASKTECEIPTHLPHQFFLSPDDESLARLYQECDIFVFASWGEGLGLPPLEAMACGAPVVVADSQGIRDYAVHEVNALVVPPKHPSALAGAILRLIHNPSLANDLAQAGIAASLRYDWEAAVDRFEGLLWA